MHRIFGWRLESGKGRSPKLLLLLLLLPAFTLAGCSHLSGGSVSANADAPRLPLEVRIEQLLSESPFDGVQWGILLIDPESGHTLFEKNATTRFIPASNMKLPVTVAALDLLGPEYRWETAFFTIEPPVNGVVSGPLRLVGTGDPTLGAPFFPTSTEALSTLADSLLAAGVQRVIGPLTIDATAWDSITVPESWMVGNLSPSFGATGGAFTIGRGEITIGIVGAPQPGEIASISWSPIARETFVRANVTTVALGEPTEVVTSFLPESRGWVVSGTISVGESRTLALAARDPVRVATEALSHALATRGIALEGGVQIEWRAEGNATPPIEGSYALGSIAETKNADEATPFRIAGLSSPPLREVVHVILDSSQNWMTEQLVRTLGAELGEVGSWGEGFRIIEDHLVNEVGIDSLDLHMEDGSGLSAYNLLTPRAIVRLLSHAQHRPWGASFRNALPAPGRAGGTLSGRLAGMEGRVHAKTGTIMNVNALSGYVEAADGRELLFSILTNGSNLPATQVRERMDAIIREVAISEAR